MKLTDVKVGDVLIADGGFTCIKENAELTVEAASNGQLYIPCSAGRHYLDGQVYMNGETLCGLTKNV